MDDRSFENVAKTYSMCNIYQSSSLYILKRCYFDIFAFPRVETTYDFVWILDSKTYPAFEQI